MKKFSKYYTVVLLIFMFAAPGMAAYLFYSHPTWLGAARTNKGHLVAHPVALSSVEKKDKWRVILWSPSACEASCVEQLDMLARMRLALGRKLYLVEQLLLVDDTKPLESTQIENELKARDFNIQELSALDKKQLQQLSDKPQIFIMDPNNYLILSYQTDVNPADIYKDLKLLLTTYETKKG